MQIFVIEFPSDQIGFVTYLISDMICNYSLHLYPTKEDTYSTPSPRYFEKLHVNVKLHISFYKAQFLHLNHSTPIAIRTVSLSSGYAEIRDGIYVGNLWSKREIRNGRRAKV